MAEDEAGELANYFVETEQWRQIYSGDIDVVYGPKGSGKSAIYSLLIARASALFDRGILPIAAENPRGATAFNDLEADPPTSEREFVNLWKLYFLSLVGSALVDLDADSDEAREVISELRAANLLPGDRSLRTLLRAAREYVRIRSVEGGVDVDPVTGLPSGLTGKITFSEPTSSQANRGFVSMDHLIEKADVAMSRLPLTVWLLLDRLDVAFAENSQLEENALRALFKVYLDLAGRDHVRLKIFLRSDIWRRITASGFREASHITRHTTIRWNLSSLLNLVMRRVVQSPAIREAFSVDASEVLQSSNMQTTLFDRIFPDQVDVGLKKPRTIDWMLTRTMDGSSENAPRELIHLLNATRLMQIRQLEIGEPEPEGELLFSRSAIKSALPEVSKVRLEQTLYAEYPNLRDPLDRLRGERTQQSPQTLARIWNNTVEEAAQLARKLVGVGFFEERGTRESPEFWVPFMYRDALDMVQGTAE